MRALAVLLVVLYHLWPNRLRGGFVGVDVFLVISGFLITSHLLRRPPTSLRDLAAFWARRIRRLLPVAFVVLVFCLLGVRVLAPATLWSNWTIEIAAAAFYVVNWRLASTSVDYLQAGGAASPVQHFWSLSVEEQFYFVWPIVILSAVVLSIRRGKRPLGLVLPVLGFVTLASLLYSVYETGAAPASAYFVTPTRMWELGAGGLLAACQVRVADSGHRRSLAWRRARSPLAWAGLAAIVIAAVAYDGETAFPGWRALLPVLGAVAIIAARPDTHWASPGRYMAMRPVQWLGGISYSVYLWHWPLIVFLPFVSGGHLGRLDKAVIIVLSLGLASLSKRFVEDRYRKPRAGTSPRLRRPFQIMALGMGLVLLLSTLQIVDVQHRQSEAGQRLAQVLAGDLPCLGAAALAEPAKCSGVTQAEVIPAPAQAAEDKSAAYADDCWETAPYDGLKQCTFGDKNGKINIALVGNSHAGHWLGPLDKIARQKGWKVTTYLGSVCTLSTVRMDMKPESDSHGCLRWSDKVLKATTGGQYDLIVTSERNGNPVVGKSLADSQPGWESGYENYLKKWLSAGKHVVVLRDTPYPGKSVKSVPDCVAENPSGLDKCSGRKEDWLPKDPLVRAATSLGADNRQISTIDMTRYVCLEDTCPGVVGGVIAYFDGSHMTNTFALTLAPYLLQPLTRAVSDATGT